MSHECPLCENETDVTEDRTSLADLTEEEVLCETCQGAVSAVNGALLNSEFASKSGGSE